MFPDSFAFLLVYLLVAWVIPSSVLGIVAGGLTRWILGRHWGRKAAIGDALLACVVTYIAMQLNVSLTPFLLAHGIIYYGDWVQLALGVASVVAWQLIQQLRSGKFSLFRNTAIRRRVVVGVLMFILLLVGVGIWYRTPPSDASLQRRFYEHRPDLEQIVKMMEQDVHMAIVSERFASRNDDYLVWPRANRPRGISDQRWNQYRELFQRAGVPDGTKRDALSDIEIVAFPDIEFSIPAASLSYAGGTSLSYVHCGNERPTDPTKAYLPCVERKESGEFRDTVWLRYKRIEGDWYILESSYPH
jgi:hypothetical protein